jgi:hypothetical protein|tara:strand:+ start:562 stop:936 length:375 start_codon:yes stop_codon:yes gene_type:complete
MDLAKRDKIIELLRSEINKTQDSVVTYLKEAKNVQNENEFLDSIKNDYKRYHKYILNEKEREREQMEMLINYLDKVLEEANLSAEMANRARFQQNKILGEMEKVKGELDRLTTSDENINNVTNI